MLHPSTKKLIDKLSEMTRRQRVSWQQGDDGKIYHDTEGFRVVLTPAPHQVLITDALGKAIESASDAEFAGVTDAHNRPYALFVSELYNEADRCARGAERAIDLLLKGLDRHEEPSAAPVGVVAVPPISGGPEDLADELASTESLITAPAPDVQGITDAVASMADEINAAAETIEAAPAAILSNEAKWIPVVAAPLAEALSSDPPDAEATLAPLDLPTSVAAPTLDAVLAATPEAAPPAVAQGYEEPDVSAEVSEAERLEFEALRKADLDVPSEAVAAVPETVIAAPQPAAPAILEPTPTPVPPAAPAAPQRYPQFGHYGRPFAPAATPLPQAAEALPEPAIEAPPPPVETPVEVAATPPAPPPPITPTPAPAPPSPMNTQRFSLSGLGLGAAGARPAPAPAPTPLPVAEPPAAEPAAPVAEAPPPEPVIAPPREPAFEFTDLFPAAKQVASEPAEPASRPLFRNAEPADVAVEEDKTPEPAGDAHTPGRPRRFNPWQ